MDQDTCARVATTILHERRKLGAQIASGEISLEEAEDYLALLKGVEADQAAALKSENLRQRKRRWRRFASAGFPLPGRIRGELTEAQAAVMKAICTQARGAGRCRLTKGRIVYLAGVSEPTVKKTIRLLERLGFINRVMHRKGRMNEANEYVLADPQLAAWAGLVFRLRRGVQTDPQYIKSYSSVASDTESQAEPSPGQTCPDAIEIEAVQHPSPSGEVLTDMARSALKALKVEISDEAGPETITEKTEALLHQRIPHFRPQAWTKFHALHGPRAELAVLSTLLIEHIRSQPARRDTPAAMRRRIQDPARYLHGILARRPRDCRPELTLGAILARRTRPEPIPSHPAGAIAEAC